MERQATAAESGGVTLMTLAALTFVAQLAALFISKWLHITIGYTLQLDITNHVKTRDPIGSKNNIAHSIIQVTY